MRLWVVCYHGSVIGCYSSAVDAQCVQEQARGRTPRCRPLQGLAAAQSNLHVHLLQGLAREKARGGTGGSAGGCRCTSRGARGGSRECDSRVNNKHIEKCCITHTCLQSSHTHSVHLHLGLLERPRASGGLATTLARPFLLARFLLPGLNELVVLRPRQGKTGLEGLKSRLERRRSRDWGCPKRISRFDWYRTRPVASGGCTIV